MTESAGPAFEVHVDEAELAEDLAHATEAARAAIAKATDDFRDNGVPSEWLRKCDAEARDGTRLGGCVKLYIPQPAGQWGAVFLGGQAKWQAEAVPARGRRASSRGSLEAQRL